MHVFFMYLTVTIVIAVEVEWYVFETNDSKPISYPFKKDLLYIALSLINYT